ncbi:hypothetical protein AALB47_27665 [Lachnospiraceae bacterium 54-11]
MQADSHKKFIKDPVRFLHGRIPFGTADLSLLRSQGLLLHPCLLQPIPGGLHRRCPDFIIPYSGYGLFFFLRVLAEYFLHLSTVERLCERFCITLSQLRRWLQLFRVQNEDWLGVLSSMDASGLSFLKSLLTQPAYSDFASAFVRRFTKSFLQSHKNPALYCQQVFGP